MNSQPYIVGIGAANLDISGRCASNARFNDSNPGKVSMSCGGVTRNILENYCRLSGKGVLLSCVGNDEFGDMIIDGCKDAGIDTSHVLKTASPTSSYINILDNNGEMLEAVSDMRIMTEMTVEYVRQNDYIIKGSRMIVCDPSIPVAVMDYILDHYEVDMCVDPVSQAYARILGDRIGRFTMAKPNVMEAEILAGIKVNDHADLVKAARILIDKGLKKVFITRGAEGCLYYDNQGRLEEYCLPKKIAVRNVTGAGDAFTAAAIYGSLNGYDPEKILRMASAASWIALESEYTINPGMSLDAVDRKMKEIDYDS